MQILQHAKVIEGWPLNKFNTVLQEHINEGWIPSGTMTTTDTGVFILLMVKPYKSEMSGPK